MEAVHHIQQERQHYRSYTSELWDCAEGSQRLTVAGERDYDSSFPVGSDKVESLLCYLPKRFACVWVFFVFNPVLIYCKAINCPKQSSDAVTPPRVSLLLGDSPLVHTVHAVG